RKEVVTVLQLYEGGAAGRVEQRGAIGVPDAAAECSIPICLNAQREYGYPVLERAVDAEIADITFDAGHPIRRELPVEPGLQAAGEADAGAVGHGEFGVGAAVGLRSAHAGIQARVEAGPIIGGRDSFEDRRAFEIRSLRRSCNKRRKRSAS